MVIAIPLGLGLGVALGAVGGGGAVLAIPLLVYVVGQDVHTATTTSLAVVAAAALAAGATQASRARVCWPQVAVFTPAAIGGAVLGTLGNQSVSGTAILLAFVPVLFAAAIAIWRRAGEQDASADSACPALARPRTIAAGLSVGVLTGFFGVGGGFLVVPALALGMRLPLRRAIATSLVIVAAVSLAALAAHLWRSAALDSGVTITMAAACVTGSLIGVRLGASLPRRTLGHAFALLVTLVAIYLLAAIALGGGAPSG